MGSQATPENEVCTPSICLLFVSGLLINVLQLPVFDRIYDALDVYQSKDKMPKYTFDVKHGDIALIEMYVTRWAVKDDATDKGDNKSNYGRAREWKKWNVEFRLDAISVLYPGSDYTKEEIRPDEDFAA